MTTKLEWTRIQETYGDKEWPACSTYRARVPGGWLVTIWAAPKPRAQDAADTATQTFAGGITFVPDPAHAWELAPHPSP